MPTLEAILSFIKANPTIFAPLFGALFSFLFGLARALIAKSDRVQAAYTLFCKLFPDFSDPGHLWDLVKRVIWGNSAPPKLPPGAGAALVAFGFGVATVALSVVAPGCAFLSSPEAKVVEQDAAKVAECVIPKLVLGESSEQIAIECAVDLLTVQRIAAAHKAGALKACPAPAVSK